MNRLDNFRISLLRSLLIVVTGLALHGHLFGQADQGAITGTVTDAQAAVAPGASVRLTNTDTNFVLQTTTDARGVYIFQPVKIGHYALQVSASGFATTTREGLEVQVDQRLGVDVTLTVGAQSERITVEANGSLLQTEDASTGKVVSAQQINDTPLSGRNWVFIAQLTAGVSPPNASRGTSAGDFNANGQRATQNNFILDGVDNNSNAIDFLNGASYVVKPPPDALQEFRISTGGFSAEFGHSAGAVVNASIKSGSNKYSGNLWEYFRNDALNARDLFSPSKPKYRQNQFGGTFGGPILRNKLFFFADTEALIIHSGSTLIGTVPTSLMRQGDFSELLNPALTGQGSPQKLFEPGSAGTVPMACGAQANSLCPSQIDPLALKLFNMYPMPNANGNLTYNNYVTQPTATNLTNQFDVRVDYNLSSKDQMFARYSWSNNPIFSPTIFAAPIGGPGTKLNYGQNAAISETHIFGPSLTNELRFGFNYGHFYSYQYGVNTTGLAATLGLGGIPGGILNGGLPSIAISQTSGTSLNGLGSGGTSDEHENVPQLLDNLTKILGSHAIRAGFNLQEIRYSTLQPSPGRGSYTYNGTFTGQPGVSFTGSGMADFLTNNMYTATLDSLNLSQNERWYRGAYVQDDWKLTPKLTVNLGLRYDFFQPPYEKHDHMGLFIPTSPLTAASSTGIYELNASQQNIALSPTFLNLLAQSHITLKYVTGNRSLVESQKLAFAPRFGIAYRMSDRLVLRTGFGIFFGGAENLGNYPNLAVNYPYEALQAFPSGSCSVVSGTPQCQSNGLLLETGFAGLAGSLSTPRLNGFESQWKDPYSEQYNFSLEYALGHATSVEAAYVGSVSRHLQVVVDPNGDPVLTAPGVNINLYRPYPGFGTISFISQNAVATYNALQTTVKRRLSNGLSFLATYTWSHSLDDSREPLPSGGEGGYRSYPILGIQSDYSNSAFDVRQRFTISPTYELPFGAGRRYLNKGRLSNQIAGGWTATLVWTGQTGFPFTVKANNVVANGAASGLNAGPFPTLVGNAFQGGGSPNATNPNITCPAQVQTIANWYNPCAFANPPNGNLILPGQVLSGAAALAFMGGPRSQIPGPGYNRANLSLYKSFTITERQFVQFRVDCFNISNTPSLGLPNGTLATTGGQITTSRNFGANTPDARFFQFALKYYF